MNIKEIFQKILREFTLDNKGNPIYPKDPSIKSVAKKYGYKEIYNSEFDDSHELDDHDDKHYSRYKDKNGNMIDHTYPAYEDDKDSETWDHFFDHGELNHSGNTAEDLDKHLEDYHKIP